MFELDNQISETFIKLMLHCHANIWESEKVVAAEVCQLYNTFFLKYCWSGANISSCYMPAQLDTGLLSF